MAMPPAECLETKYPRSSTPLPQKFPQKLKHFNVCKTCPYTWNTLACYLFLYWIWCCRGANWQLNSVAVKPTLYLCPWVQKPVTSALCHDGSHVILQQIFGLVLVSCLLGVSDPSNCVTNPVLSMAPCTCDGNGVKYAHTDPYLT